MDKVDTLETLKAEGYEIVEEFTVNNTMRFVARQYRLKDLNVYTWSFLVAMMMLGACFGVMIAASPGILEASNGSVYVSLLFFMIVLIPIHELLHGYGFKKMGAKRLKYGVIWSSFAFYCAAYDFVANYKQFRVIGLLPNIVINLILLIAFIIVIIAGGSPFWQVALWFTLFFHASGGIGDMALVGYLYKHRKEGVVTYDDMDKMISYMLIRKEKEC